MTTETMTIHKALSEIKVLNDRISKEIGNSTFCIANKHINKKIKGKSIDDVKIEMQASYNKITDLIKRRTAIKKAVTLSNATAKVTVGGKEMTVAEAIELKAHGIEYQKELLETMSAQYGVVLAYLEKNNGEALSQKADQYITQMYGAKDTKIDPADVATAREDYVKNNTYDLIQGIDMAKEIEKLSAEIDAFTSDVDSILSTSNAITNITIEY